MSKRQHFRPLRSTHNRNVRVETVLLHVIWSFLKFLIPVLQRKAHRLKTFILTFKPRCVRNVGSRFFQALNSPMRISQVHYHHLLHTMLLAKLAPHFPLRRFWSSFHFMPLVTFKFYRIIFEFLFQIRQVFRRLYNGSKKPGITRQPIGSPDEGATRVVIFLKLCNSTRYSQDSKALQAICRILPWHSKGYCSELYTGSAITKAEVQSTSFIACRNPEYLYTSESSLRNVAR